jgi:hydroxymethylpyrimidine kinase/phosphomethylpyrimidine kinase/thiamine-phosphate diphosphorylase
MVPTVLTVAGSDSSGGAGIQADLKAIAACGGYGASVVTALTAQNTTGVRAAEPVAAGMVRAQLAAVFDDLDVRAVKTGMLATAELVETVARVLAERRPPVCVCDPVMVAKSGDSLLAADAVEALRRRMLPLATLLTPNAPETEVLSGRRVRTLDDAVGAARALVALGPEAVLVKGGHLAGPRAVDVLVTRDGIRFFEAERLSARHTHGTGCTYAAAIATHLAHGRPLVEAVLRAKRFVTEAIRHGLEVGHGIGPTNPFWDRPRAGSARVGRLHVLVHPGDGLARMAAEAGAEVVQVRDKGTTPTAARVALVREAIAVARPHGVQVVVNDRVDVAAEAGADGVHLGGEDTAPEVARRLLGEGALVGGTANSLEEALAWTGRPIDYLGVGPVFGTRTKANPAPPLGLDALARIVRAVDRPVIAIGNVTPDRVEAVLATGAHGIAVASAVADAEDPGVAVRALRRALDAGKKIHA